MSTAPVLINRQMRFAVVMYGGGSLAIYINGVAQELLRMSQATDGKKRLYPGMTAIYRKIALLLSGHNAVYEKVTRAEGELSELQKSPKSEKRAAQIAAKEAEIAALLATDVTVEFIIDVLSGSSAGGINSVFLSKALIGGTPDMSDLQKLWLEEGDFAKLLNDRDSVRDNDLEAPLVPTSLLNSQRMYLQLLKALDGMSARFSKDAGRRQPLDLFVTYTDFDGLPTKLILSDKTVFERVHKRVFNFRYDADRNDFKAENNPFLAFAARCTSSFPVAFEPMKLSLIDDVIRLAATNYPADSSLNKDWDRFFEQISDQHGELVNWRERWFVDGGCLDNKPFSYAISKLTERAGEGIVERKLLYIEPSPEDFNRRGRRRGEAPNAVENVFAQAAGLPSYETIREDLQRVLDHNRLIERVNRLTEEVEQDFAQNGNWLTGFVRRNSAGINWKNADFRNVILEKGAAFIPYYRLRIGSATEQLAQFANHVIRTEPQSVDFGFLRTILRLWRATRYTEYRHENFKTYNRFLHDFDLEYRHRRLRFVLQKAESMLTELDGFRSRLKSIATDRQVPTKQTVESTPSDIEATSETVVQNKFGTLSFDGAVWTALPGKTDEERRAAAATLSGLDDADYAASIIAVQSELRNAYDELRRNSERLRTAISSDPDESDKSTFSRQTALIREALAQVKSAVGEIWRENEAEIGRIVKASGRNARPSETDRLLLALFHENKLPTALTSPLIKFTAILLETLHGEDGVLTRTSAIVKKALAIGDDAPPEDQLKSFVRSYLRNFYFLFDNYDQISFPVFYESPVGEAVKIDVVRVSSRDAKSLIDEEKEGEERRKLAGGYLFSFGAFLDRRWRLNDIMWGRLDGAERLISTLLSDEKFATERAALIRQANELIIQEMLGTAAKESFQSTLVDALINSAVGATERGAIDRSLAKLEQPARESGLADVMTAALDETELCNFVTSSYEVDRKLEPQSSLEILARSTRIIGDIAGSIADSSAIGGSRLRWIARVGELLARVVSVATPNGFFNLLFTRWLQILYVFELLMIGVATFLGESNTQKLGVTLLIITIGIHLFVTFLQDLLIGDDILKRMLNALLLGFFAILALSGLAFIAALFFVPEFWGLLAAVQAYVARLEIGHLQRLLIAVPPAIVILTVTIWRRAARFDLTFTGRVLIAAAILITATASYLFSCDVGSLFFPANDGDFIRRFSELAMRSGEIKSFFWVDTLIFVPLYLSTLLLLSVLFKLRRWRFVTSVRFLVVLSVFLAAGADIAENFTGLISVNEPVAIRPGTALSMFVMTAVKFGAVFVAFGLTALVFVRRDWKNVWNLVAATLMIAAGSGLVGVTAAIFGFGEGWHEDLIGLAQLVAIVVLAAAGIGFQAGSLQKAFREQKKKE